MTTTAHTVPVVLRKEGLEINITKDRGGKNVTLELETRKKRSAIWTLERNISQRLSVL